MNVHDKMPSKFPVESNEAHSVMLMVFENSSIDTETMIEFLLLHGVKNITSYTPCAVFFEVLSSHNNAHLWIKTLNEHFKTLFEGTVTQVAQHNNENSVAFNDTEKALQYKHKFDELVNRVKLETTRFG